jgi:hypothetical protein
MSTEQTNSKEPQTPQTPANQDNHGKDLVTVTINGKPKEIHRGNDTVTELKVLLGVDASQALDEVIGGEFKPLEDTQRITIKGGEVFVSHARHGGSA